MCVCIYICIAIPCTQTLVKNCVIYSLSVYGNTWKPVEGLSVNSQKPDATCAMLDPRPIILPWVSLKLMNSPDATEVKYAPK